MRLLRAAAPAFALSCLTALLVAACGNSKGSGGGPGIQLLRRLATARGADEADLLSYILFDGHYAAEVARLGYEDGRLHHDELAKFLHDAVVRE